MSDNQQTYSHKIKTIYITLDHAILAKNSNTYRDTSLCELMLGIYPSTIYDSSQKKHKIVVQGLIPNGLTYKLKKFKLGDIILTINDVQVDMDNIEGYLNAFKAHKHLKVQVTSQMKTIKFDEMSLNEELSHISARSTHIEVVKGERSKETSIVYNIPHTLMILSLNDSTNQQEDKDKNIDLLYKYPKNNDSFVIIRGVFLTLAMTLSDISKQEAKNCKFKINNQQMQACFIIKKDYLVVVSIPSDFCDMELFEAVTKRLENCIDFSYFNLKRSLTNATNRKHLDCLFSLFFQRLLLKNNLNNLNTIRYNDELKLRIFNVLPWLELPCVIRAQFDELFHTYEANEFIDFDGDVCTSTKQFYIKGCSLFYKHHTLVTHLNIEQTKAIYNYCDNYGLFILSSNVITNEIQVWKDVYFIDGDVTEKNYMILIGYKEFLIGILLECNNIDLGPNELLGADPFLMEHSKLLMNEINESGLMQKVNKWYQSGSSFQLANVNSLANGKNQKINSPKSLKKPTNDNLPLDTNDNILKKHRFTISLSNLSTDTLYSQKLPHNGLKDSIFYYIHSEENSNGILVCPTTQDVDLLYSDLFADILNGFMRACVKMKTLFDFYKKNSMYPFIKKSQSNVIEQGIQFEISRSTKKNTSNSRNTSPSNANSTNSRKNSLERADKSGMTTVNYWVVGRRVGKPYERDFFICFNDLHENLLQDVAFVDLAFEQCIF